MDAQVAVIVVLALALVGMLVVSVMQDRQIAAIARSRGESDSRTISLLSEQVKSTNTAFMGFANQSLEKLVEYDPGAREAMRIRAETQIAATMAADARAKMASATPRGMPEPAANGRAPKRGEHVATGFSDSGSAVV